MRLVVQVCEKHRGIAIGRGASRDRIAQARDELFRRRPRVGPGLQGGLDHRHQHRGTHALARHVGEDDTGAVFPEIQAVVVVSAAFVAWRVVPLEGVTGNLG